MKKLMTILAALVALCGPVQAEDQTDWFNGGIGANWPTNATMFGGTWCDWAEAHGHMSSDNSVLQISSNEDDRQLSFDVDYRKTLGPKALGDTTAAKEVAVSFACAFQPFSLTALPEVPADAKGAVILVTEDDPDEAAYGTVYYAAYDDNAKKNIWKPSIATGVGTGEIFQVTITVAPGTATGSLTVGYVLSNRDSIFGVALHQTNTVSSGMYFTGVGQATSLTAAYKPGGSHELNLVPVSGLSVTNVTADGVSVGSGYGTYFVGDGADVVVYYAVAPGYEMKGDGVVKIGRVMQDTTVDRSDPRVPKVDALGTYLVDSEGIYTIYAKGSDFVEMAAALKDGDTVEMLKDAELPPGAWLTNSITFLAGKYGEYVLSSPSGGPLKLVADVVFTATVATNLPPFFVCTDCTLTLPSGPWMSPGVYSITNYMVTGQEYAYVRIDGNEWVFLGGKWQPAGLVTMRFYYPGYFDSDCVALTLEGQLGRPVEYDLLAEYDESICQDDFVQKFYWDSETEMLIDYVYWYDDRKWSDAPTNGNAVAFPPERYVAPRDYPNSTVCDFYPGSTAITYRITYELGVADATHGNPTCYSIVTPVGLGDASAKGWAFEGWTNALGQSVTVVDPVALGVAAARAAGTDAGWLYDITLYASWSPQPQTTSAPAKMKTAMFAPGKTAAYYDTDEQAQTAAAAVNADETGGVLPPAKYTGDRVAYSANFKATANGSTVAVDLTEDAKEKIASKVDGATLSAAAGLTDPSVSTVTIEDAEPGFYYSVIGMTAVDGVVTEGARKLAQESTVELTKPDLGNAGKAFFRIKAVVK